jgi:acylphosphatase
MEVKRHVAQQGKQGTRARTGIRQRAGRVFPGLHGLAGWVKNLPDGRVEAVFEGPSESVREMVGWCESGPSQADVEDVEAEYGEAGSELRGFEVR